MINIVQSSGQGMTLQMSTYERVTDVYMIAKRMFNEGFKKSTILRITGLNEEEFVGLIRDLNRTRPTLA